MFLALFLFPPPVSSLDTMVSGQLGNTLLMCTLLSVLLWSVSTFFYMIPVVLMLSKALALLTTLTGELISIKLSACGQNLGT